MPPQYENKRGAHLVSGEARLAAAAVGAVGVRGAELGVCGQAPLQLALHLAGLPHREERPAALPWALCQGPRAFGALPQRYFVQLCIPGPLETHLLTACHRATHAPSSYLQLQAWQASCCNAAHLTAQVLPSAAVCRAGWLDARDAGAAHSTVMGVSNSRAKKRQQYKHVQTEMPPQEEGGIGQCTCVGMPWQRFFLVLVEKARLPASPAAGLLPVY